MALRDALENLKELPANAGVFTMTPEDHSGMDKRGRVIVEIKAIGIQGGDTLNRLGGIIMRLNLGVKQVRHRRQYPAGGPCAV